MKYKYIVGLICVAFVINASAQEEIAPIKDPVIYRANVADTNMITNSDAIYTRPFIGVAQSKTALGGYVEGNTNYFSDDGVSEGFSMELRRFNLFVYSKISERITFLSELEFEHGTEEIAIETAQLDFQFNQALNFRAGILLPQIGIFNANHDSPNWDVIDRPMSSTRIIPSTLFEAGFGLFGKVYPGSNIISYNVYILNGLQSGIVLNDEGRTSIPGGKNEGMFEEDNNGSPSINSRIALTNRQFGEIGLSYYGGIYNDFQMEGEQIADKRMVQLIAVDFSLQLGAALVQGEYVNAMIDIPADLEDFYATKQNGGFIELIFPVVKKPILGYEKARVNLVLRGEQVDLNNGTFEFNGEDIGDEESAFVAGLSFRPTSSSSFRMNYRRHLTTDLVGNPPAPMAGFQFGFATYF